MSKRSHYILHAILSVLIVLLVFTDMEEIFVEQVVRINNDETSTSRDLRSTLVEKQLLPKEIKAGDEIFLIPDIKYTLVGSGLVSIKIGKENKYLTWDDFVLKRANVEHVDDYGAILYTDHDSAMQFSYPHFGGYKIVTHLSAKEI